MSTNNPTIAALLAKVAAKKAATATATATATAHQQPEQQQSSKYQFYNQYGELISYNAEQTALLDLTEKGESCVLLGAAGTGKTTCMRGVIELLSQDARIPAFNNVVHKHLPSSGVPGIICVSFTRRAVTNLKRAMPDHMKDNCITIHKALEYEPVYYEIEDPVTRVVKTTMRFEPARHAHNPLPNDIKVVIIDEASMVSTTLFEQLKAALPHKVQYIFLGDLNQLPPVFDTAILGYKILELPVIELTQVYRQALESPIIKYATSIRQGQEFHLPEKLHEDTSASVHGGIATFHPWKKALSSDNAMLTTAKFFQTALEHGGYSPEEDMILTPYNKAYGTIEINKHIANFLARKAGSVVYEVIAGFNKHYFRVGDKVMYNREDAVITAITRNAMYRGKLPQEASDKLDYWGTYDTEEESHHIQDTELDDIDTFLSATVSSEDDERVNAASHIITIKMSDSDKEVTLDAAAEINALDLGYALTVHKSQGSEWRKVFVVLHRSQATMLFRELLYTAITRARHELYVICEKDTFQKGVRSQRIKGNTLAEKAEYFKGKLAAV